MEFLFGGRLGRLGYFGYSLGFGIFLGLLLLPVGKLLIPDGGAATPNRMAIATFIYVLALFASVFVGLILTVKRLHDFGLSGWYYLLVLVVPTVIYGLAFGLHSKDLAAVGAGTQLLIWFLMCFWPGTEGPNAYGER
jgi:uncharacterized membrane protein YhaH (DUF805 family)